ncbi:MAG: zinc dependent phospholipase C family protein [Clostridia bacterium]|nr:zinc dependent phospholipase C family protein [Clostridia bacterium]
MPSVITHYVLAKRALSCVNVANEEAFLLGAQGPDMFFFFRAYPWMPGRAGLPLGNAIHETKPSVLIESMCRAAAEVGDEDGILESYISGFLCHYAADRTIHPFVHDRQTALRDVLPCHAQTDDPYHYYCESAFDVYVLRVDEGRDVSSFKLTAVLPPRDSRR